MTRKQDPRSFSSCWSRRSVKEMFISQYVCLIAFTLLYLVSSLNTECDAFHMPEYISSHFTRRIKRQGCEFRCLNGQCIYRHQHCDGKSDCLDEWDEFPEICAATTTSVAPPSPALRDESCALPPQPANGEYTVGRSSTVLTYSCSSGYQLYPFPNNNIAICHSGKWYPGLSECLRLCEPRISDSVDTYCEHNNIAVDCAKSMVEGTTVRMYCKHSYSQVDSPANPVSVCRDGSWDYAFITCVPGQMSTPRDDSCALPLQPANGEYTVGRSSTVLTYSCSPGYQIYPSPNNNVAICHSGKWYPHLSECERTCGPRISDSVETYCERKGIKVDCSKPMIEGTTVRMNCKHLYSQVDSSANPVSVCKDGSWDYAFIECVPECGRVVPQGDIFIIGGEYTKKGKFPWHVGIYKLNSTNQYEQKCGGSIISRKLILSAAHCFTNPFNGAPLDVKQYAIAAGKYYRDYYDERDTLSQTSTIKEIIIPPRYKGLLTSFTADIAFLILDKALEMTHVVQPVCIDWDNQYETAQLKENNIGTVVGWGYTREGEDPSAELKQLSAPFVNFETCFDEVPESFTRFLTSDKFCAGFTNGSSICHGDTGGGLVFLLSGNKKYYLRGLVSAGPIKEGKCDSRQYDAYTKVSDYMETLRRVDLSTRV